MSNISLYKVSFRFLSRCFRTFSGYYISLLYHHRVPNNISTEERRGEVLMVFWYGASIFHSSFVSLSICNANSHCNWFFDKKAHVLSVTDKLCDGNKSEREKRENKQIQNKSERTARIFTAALEVEPEEWKVLPGYTYPIVPIHMCECVWWSDPITHNKIHFQKAKNETLKFLSLEPSIILEG